MTPALSGLLTSLVACGSGPEVERPPPPHLPPSVDTAPPVVEGPEVQQARNRAPRITKLRVTPKEVTVTDTLRVAAEAEDPDGGMAVLRYSWVVNNRELPGQDCRVLNGGLLNKGDKVVARVTANDGLSTVSKDSAPLTVANSPPRFLDPADALSRGLDGYTFTVEDPDGDELRWSVRGAPPGLEVTDDGTLRWSGTFDDAAAGTYEAEVVVEDGDGGYAAWPLTLEVSAGKEAERRKRGR